MASTALASRRSWWGWRASFRRQHAAGTGGLAVKFIITRQGQGDKSSMPKKMRALSVTVARSLSLSLSPSLSLCLYEHSYLFSSISIKNKVQQQQQQEKGTTTAKKRENTTISRHVSHHLVWTKAS